MTDLAKLSWPEVKTLVEGGCAAILPVGSTEAHGPHLPLDTDVTIALGTARRAAAALEASGRACVVLPPVAYAVTDYAGEFAGTVGISSHSAVMLLQDVLMGALRAGFRPVAVANGHLEPAHLDTVRAAIANILALQGDEVLFPDVTRRFLAQRLTDEFKSGACHAGSYESSLVMADDPDAVKDDVRQALPPVDISLVDAIRAGRDTFLKAGGTQAYFGRPADATAAEGHATYDILATMLVEAIEAAGAA